MDTSLVAKIARRLVKKALLRPALVEVESFSKKRFSLSRMFRLKQASGAAPMIVVKPKYLVKDSGPGRDVVTVSLDVTLDRKHAHYLNDPKLAADIAAYLDKP